eukprot:358274-Chlamydomonas_euryale.AAC.4
MRSRMYASAEAASQLSVREFAERDDRVPQSVEVVQLAPCARAGCGRGRRFSARLTCHTRACVP